MNAHTIALPTGTLELSVHESAFAPDALLGYAARVNAKRGFLFLSKVLGKHWPVTPDAMTEVHEHLAASVPTCDGAVVFIAMAETAIGLGQGVFEAWQRTHPGDPALFLHTTRYRVGQGELIEFEEAHSHAPRQFLHVPTDPALRAMLLSAHTLVLVDDEASTGNTFLNLTRACRALNAQIGHVHLATITNFMGVQASAELSNRFGLPVSIGAALSGQFRFTPGQMAPSTAPAQRFDPAAERGASATFGRLGRGTALTVPEPLVRKLAADVLAGQRVLVLGTGEFMHAAFVLARALARCAIDVVIQSSTRSPILSWGAVSHTLSFPDNYGEGVANFLYNVVPGQYHHVLICHETPPNAAMQSMADLLGARLFHFISETHVEEVSHIPVR